MLSNYFKNDLTIKTLSETVDSKKIVRKTYTAQPIKKCMFVVLSQGKVFQNEKDTVTSNCMCYCSTDILVKMRDRAIVDTVEYEVVGILNDVKGHHRELYFVQV